MAKPKDDVADLDNNEDKEDESWQTKIENQIKNLVEQVQKVTNSTEETPPTNQPVEVIVPTPPQTEEEEQTEDEEQTEENPQSKSQPNLLKNFLTWLS
jgi:hypothetical protein